MPRVAALVTTMPVPDNKPINITRVQAMEKYKCLFDTSPQYNINTLHGRIIKILYMGEKEPCKYFQGSGTSLPHILLPSPPLYSSK